MSKLFITDIDELSEDEVASLSASRREKASKFVFEKDRKLSLAAGIAFARGLESYGLKEGEAELAYGKYGKPYLKSHPSLFFNLSHSGSKAIAAFDEREIGCDIERIRPFSREIADRCFHEKEKEYLKNASDIDEAFTRIWVYKESFLKALGSGICEDLSSFASFPSLEGPRLEQNLDGRGWAIQESKLENYIIALCVQEEKEI